MNTLSAGEAPASPSLQEQQLPQQEQQRQQQQQHEQQQRKDGVSLVSNGASPMKSRRRSSVERNTNLETAVLLEVLRGDTGLRSVEKDYSVPSWLRRQGVTAPCEYAKTFKGKLGIINYEVTGPQHQRTVLTFHGLNGTMQTFQDLQNILTGFGFRVITFDLYGHGLSGAPPYSYFRRRYSLDFFVSQARDLLMHLGLQNTVLAVVGFSMVTSSSTHRLGFRVLGWSSRTSSLGSGVWGVIAAHYACRYPSLVSSVALISAAGLLPKKPWGVSVLQRCGCCCSPLYLCVPCCLCRCCFDKNNFVRRYEREGAEATAGMPAEPEQGRPCGGRPPSPGEEGPPEGDEGKSSVRLPQETNGVATSSQKSNREAAAAAAAEGAPAPVAAAAAVESGAFACPPNAAGPCMQHGNSSSSSSSPALMLWKRLTWQVFAKKGSISTFVGCVTHVPLWDGESVYQQLGKQQTPCLVLWGGDDPVVGVDCCRRLCSLIPNHASVVFPGCHHLLLAERPHACIALVLTFLDFPSSPSCLDRGGPSSREKGGPSQGKAGSPGERGGPPYMPVWRFLLPFDSNGEYVHPRSRCPPGETPKGFLNELNYKPAFFVCFGGLREGRGAPRVWGGPFSEHVETVVHQRRRLSAGRGRDPQQQQRQFQQQQQRQYQHQQQQEYLHPVDVFEEGPCDKDEGIMVTPDAEIADSSSGAPHPSPKGGNSPVSPVVGSHDFRASSSFQNLLFADTASQNPSTPSCMHFSVSKSSQQG
ncbi:hypothetical protein Esti_001339 [Eimeria stiedai]